jgi:hypothetical protein
VVSRLAEAETPAVLGAEALDVYLNSSVLGAMVPVAVWRYTLGGYQVMKKWLSYREKSVLGRDLTMDMPAKCRAWHAELQRSFTRSELDANYRASSQICMTAAVVRARSLYCGGAFMVALILRQEGVENPRAVDAHER